MAVFPPTKHLWQILQLGATPFDLSIKSDYLEFQSSREMHNKRKFVLEKKMTELQTLIDLKLFSFLPRVLFFFYYKGIFSAQTLAKEGIRRSIWRCRSIVYFFS